MVILSPKKPGGAIIEVWQMDGVKWDSWNFAITHNGVRRRFAGSNRCDTKHSAICKARIRARWLDEGTYDEHYVVSEGFNKPIKAYNDAMKRIEDNNITDGLNSLVL